MESFAFTTAKESGRKLKIVMRQILSLPRRRPAPQSRAELLARAQALSGISIGQLAQALGMHMPLSSVQGKGLVGTLVELALGADQEAKSRPDFPHLGIELKTIPVDAHHRVLESTFCCAVTMKNADSQVWESSCLKRRLDCVLFLPVVYPCCRAAIDHRILGLPCLWSPNPAQKLALRFDWELLIGKIGAGQFAHLSGFDGDILQVRPKAAHAGVRTWASGPEGILRTLPLGFYLRARFTAGLLT